MNETTTPVRKPLTDKTWADFRSLGLLPRKHHDSCYSFRLGWEVECDLGYELAGMSHLSVEQARLLVELCAGGLPVVLSWEHRIGNRYEGWRVERRSTTVIVEGINAPAADPKHRDAAPGMVRVKYCGFGHPIYLNEITDVRNVESTYEYVAVCIECDQAEDRHREGCVADDMSDTVRAEIADAEAGRGVYATPDPLEDAAAVYEADPYAAEAARYSEVVCTECGEPQHAHDVDCVVLKS